MFFIVALAPYIIAMSDTQHSSLYQSTLDTLPICGNVTPPTLYAIIIIETVCHPHIYDWRQYFYIYQASAAALHIFEVEVNFISESSKFFFTEQINKTGQHGLQQCDQPGGISKTHTNS